MKVTHLLIACFCMLAGACSCSKSNESTSADTAGAVARKSCNAIYHWKTTFNSDSAEWEFVNRHNIGRLYVRMFDVGMQGYEIVPIATTVFKQAIPDTLEIVPVVYVTIDALRYAQQEERCSGKKISQLAQKICTRVTAMCKANNIPNVRELQIDCDWTKSTRDAFDKLCREMKKYLADTVILSSTIRLHQLSQTPPPTDRGMLMVYNTGGITSPKTRNSIIDMNDIKPYLRNINWDMPMDVAYPAFEWSLLYRNGKTFGGILYRMDWCDIQLYQPCGENRYKVLHDHDCGETYLKKGDIIRVEKSSANEVMSVAEDIKLYIKPENVVIYHLDSKNLSNYTKDEIQKIYSVD